MTIEKEKITIEVALSAFTTEGIAHELVNRIDDFLNDPEPKADDYCERIPKEALEEVLVYLRNCNREWDESKNGGDN
jgi:hypothetical protein